MPVIGTAGHVDHGKSTLLTVLTGRDPDRWEEEKRRGLTIDLGFTWMTLPSGREISFVDVPGHERFIKNMLAGIEAVDAALLVVAADEGWMPQSEEHLVILDQLGVERAVVALTKVDRVDTELVELATLEVAERLEGTSLAGSEVVPVSAPARLGLDSLVARLDELVRDDEPGPEIRMWVDRRFTIAGAGTVVTGTLLQGRLTVGDTLAAYPGGQVVRIRGIESHERAAASVSARRRVAVNVTGVPNDVGRGHMLGAPGEWEATARFTAAVRPVRYVTELNERGSYHLHVGSAAVGVRMRFVGGGALLTTEHPLPLRYGDRFILRETGRRAVVGGGTVLDPSPPQRGAALAAAAGLSPGLSPEEAASALLSLRTTDSIERLRKHTGAAPVATTLVHGQAVTDDAVALMATRASALVGEFQETLPLRPGLPIATLVSRLGAVPEIVQHVVEKSTDLDTDGSVVWRRGRAISLTDEQTRAWEETQRILTEAEFAPPRVDELPVDSEVIHHQIRRGELEQISDGYVYRAADAEKLRTAIAAMEDPFTVADFRDATGISRRHAVPILEWSDRVGLTRRRGDLRSPI